MKNINKLIGGFLLILFVGTYTSSCTKEENREFNQERMFTPGRISITTEQKQARITWNPSLFAELKTIQYTVELAKDSSFQNIEYTVQSDTAGVVITDDVLKPRQRYVARVKANTNNNTPESKWILSARFSITGEQLFRPLQSGDIIDNAVLLKWTVTQGLTKITVTPPDAQPYDVTLSATDLAAGQKIIKGLKPNTPYSVELYAGTKSRGYLEFQTNPTLSGNIIDLRGIDNRSNVLDDTLAVIPTGSKVILERGVTYNIEANASLNKSLTFLSGADLGNTEMANIFFKASNFDLTAGAVVDSLVFNNIRFTSDDIALTNKYVFNIATISTVGKIVFESCKAELFRGFIRVKEAATISNLVINNCVINDIGNYGVVIVDHASAKVDNITLQNSTVYRVAYSIIRNSKNSLTKSVKIENCTINEAPVAAGYLVEFSTMNAASGITIQNNIFGRGKENAGSTSVKGARAGSSTAILASNNYGTSDYLVNGNAIPDLKTYAGTSSDLWVSPTTGDFTIKDNTFAGKSSTGDPKWRP